MAPAGGDEDHIAVDEQVLVDGETQLVRELQKAAARRASIGRRISCRGRTVLETRRLAVLWMRELRGEAGLSPSGPRSEEWVSYSLVGP